MTVQLKSLADLKRLPLGTTLIMTRHDTIIKGFPIGVPRKIVIKQSNAIAMAAENSTPSWLYFDGGAKCFVFNGTANFKVKLKGPEHDEPTMEYQVVEA